MNWLRVKKESPCPICKKPDYCGISGDGCVVICMRVESSRPTKNGGWLHRLTDQEPTRPRSCTVKTQSDTSPEIPLLAEKYWQAMNARRYLCLSGILGVSAKSLKRLCVGWDGKAYTFPMFDADGNIIGIRRRFSYGCKVCVTGSQNGLFLPDGLTGQSPLLIVEGNSDAAAGLDLGFDTLGRPSCSGGVDLIRQFIRKHHYSLIVIIPDNDNKPDGTNPGKSGGLRLGVALRIYCRDVRIALPPAEYNDLRCWLAAGLTRDNLLKLIEDTKSLEIRIDTQ